MGNNLSMPLEPMQDALDNCKAHLSTLESETERAIKSLIREAHKIASEYQDNFSSLSGQNGNDIGQMMASVRDKEGKAGLTLEIRWLKSVKGPRGRIRKVVNKGKAHSYTLTKLTKNSPDWESHLIEQTEPQFAAIREMYSLFMKARINNKSIRSSVAKHDEKFDY
jgi:hypothetical protein